MKGTDVTFTRLPTAPIAVPDTPLSKVFPMTGRTHPWKVSKCALSAGMSMTTLRTEDSMPSPMPVPFAVLRYACGMLRVKHYPPPEMPWKRPVHLSWKAEWLRLRAWGGFTSSQGQTATRPWKNSAGSRTGLSSLLQ